MVRLIWIYILWALLTPTAYAFDTETVFPYTAYVQSSSTSVLSGPNVSFYATDRLKQGDQVEVYRHDQEWAAIRPPAGSFSWVPVDEVRDTEVSHVVLVAVPDAISRIGSRFGDHHDTAPIKLEIDEPLEVMGQQVFRDEPAGKPRRFYKVAPPAGEFRWVRRSALGLSPPSDSPAASIMQEKSHVHPANAETSDVSVDDEEGWPATETDSAAAGPPEPRRFQRTSVESPAVAPGNSAERVRAAKRSLEELTYPPAQPRPTFDEFVRDEPAMDEPQDRSDPIQPQGQITTLTRIDSPPAVRKSPTVRAIPTEMTTTESVTGVQQVQWPSYDTAPRTDMDVISQRASSAWREVDRFRPAYVASLPGNTTASRVAAAPPYRAPSGLAPAKEGPSRTTTPSGILPLPPPPTTHSISPEYLDEELADIDLKLAENVLQAPETWTLSTLRMRTQAVIDASHDTRIRGAAQRLLVKITQFEDVRRRHKQLIADGSPTTDTPGGAVPAVQMLSATPAGLTGVNYDGAGWLMPVYTNRRDIPRYVLTDERGNVLQFVTPQPGLNLRNFERQRIGIFGQQSRVASLEHPHLVAERIVTLDIATRR